MTVINAEVIKDELIKVEQQSGLATQQGEQLRLEFSNFYGDIIQLRREAEAVTEPENKEHQRKAREVRLGLRRIRCDIETLRKALKADSLARGKAIDGFANVLKYLCEPVEAQMLEVEEYEKRIMQARLAEMIEIRKRKLLELGEDPNMYNLSIMEEDTFQTLLETTARKKEEQKELERKQEEQRIAREKAEAEERARIKAENERLRKEAEIRDAELRKERQEAERKQRELEAKARAEREAREQAERKEQERQAAEAREARAKQEAIDKARLKAQQAPDQEKLLAYVEALQSVPVPNLADKAIAQVAQEIKGILGQIEEQVKERFANV